MRKEIGLSPMAGYTDEVMRELALSWGADFVFSEMLSVEGVVRSTDKTGEIVPEKPCRVQLFGSDPERMALAARELAGIATWFDINAGCPARKVIKRGAGSALLRDPKKLAAMVLALKEVASVPVSVKLRLGWQAGESERILYPVIRARPHAVFIHGRTVSQGYSGRADWEEIERLAFMLRGEGILAYGSGDLFTPEAIVRALERTEVDGVVVARGAIGNPWIFKQAKDLIEKGAYHEFTLAERLQQFSVHFERLSKRVGENQAVKELRKSFASYTRGVRASARMRSEYMKLESADGVRKFLRTYGDVTESIV